MRILAHFYPGGFGRQPVDQLLCGHITLVIRVKNMMIEKSTAFKFKPEHAGKINFYLSTVDDVLRSPENNPGIALLYKTSDKVFAEYALRNIQKPVEVLETLTKAIPKNLKTDLPTIKEIEAEFNKKSCK